MTFETSSLYFSYFFYMLILVVLFDALWKIIFGSMIIILRDVFLIINKVFVSSLCISYLMLIFSITSLTFSTKWCDYDTLISYLNEKDCLFLGVFMIWPEFISVHLIDENFWKKILWVLWCCQCLPRLESPILWYDQD